MEIDTKKIKLDTLMLWCLSKNYIEEETIASCDAVYNFNNEKYGFITEFDRTKESLIKAINDSMPQLNYIYVLIDDISQKQELSKLLPNKVGMLSICNEFGLGTMVSVQKSAIKF